MPRKAYLIVLPFDGLQAFFSKVQVIMVNKLHRLIPLLEARSPAKAELADRCRLGRHRYAAAAPPPQGCGKSRHGITSKTLPMSNTAFRMETETGPLPPEFDHVWADEVDTMHSCTGL